MAPGAPVEVLRSGLLGGLDVVLAGHVDGLEEVLAGLGADVQRLAGEPLDEQAVAAAAAALERATVVVCASGGAMRAAADPAAGLRAAVEGAWIATRAIVSEHLSAGGFGKVLLIAPRPGDGPDAAAAGAALENLARTAGVEWARLGIRVVTVAPA